MLKSAHRFCGLRSFIGEGIIAFWEVVVAAAGDCLGVVVGAPSTNRLELFFSLQAYILCLLNNRYILNDKYDLNNRYALNNRYDS